MDYKYEAERIVQELIADGFTDADDASEALMFAIEDITDDEEEHEDIEDAVYKIFAPARPA